MVIKSSLFLPPKRERGGGEREREGGWVGRGGGGRRTVEETKKQYINEQTAWRNKDGAPLKLTGSSEYGAVLAIIFQLCIINNI